MANENMSIDVDEFVESGIEEAGEKLQAQLEEEGSILNAEDTGSKLVGEEEQEQEQETQVPAETKAPEVKEQAKETETPAQADSTISQLIQSTQQGRVPVETHVKLRQRAQKAEARVKELEESQQQQDTQPAGENAEDIDPFAELDDTDLVRVSDVKDFVGKTVNAAVGKVTQSLGQREAAEKAEKFTAQAVQSEQEVIKNTPDYGTVTKAALKLGLISKEETVEISQSDNPALEFYKRSKAKLTDIQETLGITPASTDSELPADNETPDGDDEVPDDKSILDEIYG